MSYVIGASTSAKWIRRGNIAFYIEMPLETILELIESTVNILPTSLNSHYVDRNNRRIFNRCSRKNRSQNRGT